MIRRYIFIFLWLGNLIFAETSFISGFLNDNYTGSLENGVSGRYIGADDFLTFSLFSQIQQDDFNYSVYYQILTSRFYEYRYDLLENTLTYDIRIDSLVFTPSLGLLLKGDFEGDQVQNGMHRFRGIPEVNFDYCDFEAAPIAGVKGTYSINESFSGILDVRYPFDIKPASVNLSFEYGKRVSLFCFDFLSGYKQYLNFTEEYSNFVHSGFHGGAQFVVNFPSSFCLNAGVFFFPVNNILTDPSYYQRQYSYSPQFWVTIGLNTLNFGLLDIVNY